MYRFVDEKGFIARPLYGAVILERELNVLKKYVEETSALPQKDQKALKRAIELFEKMDLVSFPKLDYHQTYEVNTNFSRPSVGKGNAPDARAILSLDRFTTSQADPHKHYPPSQSHWNWEHCPELLSLQRPLLKAFESIILQEGTMRAPEVSFKMLKRADKWYHQLTQGQIIHQEFDPTKELVRAECFAIYVGGSSGGFLDGRGQFAPLGGARLFESQASAEKTISSRGLLNAAVVCIKAQMTGLAPDQTIQGDIRSLKEAIASVEKEQLLKALDMATEEELQHATTKKRKM